MKNIVFLLAVLFVHTSLYSQDIVDPPKVFDKDTLSAFDGSTAFHIGWNWGGTGRKLDEALSVNSYHFIPFRNYSTKEFSSEIGDNIRGIQPLWMIIPASEYEELITRVNRVLFNGMSLLLEPTLPVDTTDNNVSRWNDACGGVYGFRYHNWDVGDTVPTGIDFSRFRLHAANVTSAPVVALDSIYDGTILHYLDYFGTNYVIYDTLNKTWLYDSINTNSDVSSYHSFNGKQWYLSVNLRALNRDSLLNHLNDTILSIELPYVMKDISNPDNPVFSNGTIKFSSFPNPDTSQNVKIRGASGKDFRGVYRSLIADTAMPSVFYITGSMLYVVSAVRDSNSITLSASFNTTGKTTLGVFDDNPHFRNDWWENKFKVRKFINSIDVQVKYYGKLDVGIDWIRFETRHAQAIFRGDFDLWLRFSFEELISNMESNPRNPRLSRIYGPDEMLPFQWGTVRYYNMLLDTLVSTEIYIRGNGYPDNPPNRYLKATASKEYWTGSTFFHDVNWCSAPYFRRANVNWLLGQQTNTFNALFGYGGNNFVYLDTSSIVPYQFIDTLNSAYETFLIHANWSNPLYPPNCTANIPISGNDMSLYDNFNWSPDYFPILSTQAAIEKILKKNYYEYPSLIYNDRSWWANIWPLGHIGYDTSFKSFNILSRPKTGEEVRLMTFTPIVLGAKGLFFYLKSRCSSLPSPLDITFQISSETAFLDSLPAGEELIYSDINGGDYINLNDSAYYHFKQNFAPDVYDWSLLGINQDRIYYGIKSTTAEIYKINRWIRTVEQTLVNLKLKAWFGKGFFQLYSQSPEFSNSNILEDYVYYNGIRTKKLYQPIEGQGNLINDYIENYDSSFFDITLLTNTNNTSSNDFFIACQNRRTDCLVYYFDSLKTGGGGWELRFFTTAEMDMLCRHGGPDPLHPNGTVYPAEHWQQYWWKRLGAREITIPMNYTNFPGPGYDTTLSYFRITELGTGTDLDTCWWRQPGFCHVIDTTVSINGKLSIRLLPGEGKIMKFTPYFVKRRETAGYLDYSTQRKIVAYPVRQDDIEDVGSMDTIRYHMVYFKEFQTDSDPDIYHNKICYKRSYPMTTVNNSEVINWEPKEYILSDSVLCYGTQDPVYSHIDSLDCYHPSIVVRYDTSEGVNKPMVYVVFSAKYRYHYVTETWPAIICETIFPANEALPDNRKIFGNQIEWFNSDNLINWGIPVINASRNYNFYSWSDSSRGIAAAYKAPNQLHFDYPRQKKYIYWNNRALTNFPSVNSYSRIRSDENECALVWQEGNENSRQIYYTGLSVRNDSIIHSIPEYSVTALGFIITNADNTILKVSMFDDNTMPVVYRIDDKLCKKYWGPGFNVYTSDRVFWVNQEPYSSRKIMEFNVDIFETSSAKTLYLWFYNRLFSMDKDLIQPNIAQGSVPACDTVAMGYSGDSSYVLNFVENPEYFLNPNNTLIRQIIPNTYVFLKPTIKEPDSLSNIFSFDYNVDIYSQVSVFRGQKPNLAAMPFVPEGQNWKMNRRVFEFGDSIPPDIMMSGDLFARKSGESSEYICPFIGFENNKGKYKISPLYTTINNRENALKIILRYNSEDKQLKTDTIFTEWFKIGSEFDINFLEIYKGKKTDFYSMKIQRKHDFRTFDINFTDNSNDKLIDRNLKLLNGNNREYRFIWVKTIPDLIFVPEYVIGSTQLDNETTYLDELFRKISATTESSLLDLSGETVKPGLNIVAVPNPANDYINISIFNNISGDNRSGQIKLTLISSLGMNLIEIKIKKGESINLPVEQLTNGLYFLRAEEIPEQWGDTVSTPVVEKVVISR